MAEDILKLIDKAVEEKTFSLDGLSAVQKIKDQAALLNARVEQLTTSLELSRKNNDDLKSVIQARDTEITRWKTRENELIEREKKHVDLERQCAISVAVERAQDKMFERMFANRQFRESVVGNSQRAFPPAAGQSYAATAPETVTRTILTEEN